MGDGRAETGGASRRAAVPEPRAIATKLSKRFTSELGFTRSVVLLDERGAGIFTIDAASGCEDARLREAAAFRLRHVDPAMARIANGGNLAVADTPAPLARLLRSAGVDTVHCYALGDEEGLIGCVLASRGDAVSPEGAASIETLLEQTTVMLRYAILRRQRDEERSMLRHQQAEIDNLLREIEERDALTRDELLHAQEFQRMMLPRGVIFDDFAVESVYRPVDIVSGDLYDVARVGNKLRVFVADATGHGVRAALATMVVKAEYEAVKMMGSAHEAVMEFNARIVSSYRPGTLLMTASCADIDLSSGKVEVVSAAHPSTILVAGSTIRELETGGSLLGMVATPELASARGRIGPDDALIFYTDGLSEAANMRGQLFGEERILAAIARGRLGAGTVDRIVSAVDAFVRPASFNDDLTIVAVRRVA